MKPQRVVVLETNTLLTHTGTICGWSCFWLTNLGLFAAALVCMHTHATHTWCIHASTIVFRFRPLWLQDAYANYCWDEIFIASKLFDVVLCITVCIFWLKDLYQTLVQSNIFDSYLQDHCEFAEVFCVHDWIRLVIYESCCGWTHSSQD